MRNNDEMRVIAVGDDDQNIFQFRGSDSKYMQAFINDMQAKKYEMTENYRSSKTIVDFANHFVKRISHRMKSSPCISIKNNSGKVKITQYQSENLEIPLVNHVVGTYHKERACVLTNTNDEAARIVGLLIKKGVNAKLIQSADGFRFINLAEVRYFLKLIDKKLQTPVISEENWETAKQKTLETYHESTCLDYIQEFFTAFERTNRTKYRSDLADFVFESNLEDFCGEGRQTVFVSTIHKAKGKEFDTVYMLLNNEQADTDENLRKLYVGITRAKQNLYIHCNTDVFTNMVKHNIEYNYDFTTYPTPEEITLQLTHRDVYLDFFKDKKKTILQLRSGMPLLFDNSYLKILSGEKVALISKQKRCEIKEWYEKGYQVQSAKINYIVAWNCCFAT